MYTSGRLFFLRTYPGLSKTIFSFGLAVLVATGAAAQPDSVQVKKARWTTKKIARGVKWKHAWFNDLYGSHQNIDILQIKPRRKISFAVGYEKKDLVTTSGFAERAHALAAINGNFFDVKNGGSVDFLKVNNELVSESQPEQGARARHQRAAIAIQDRGLSIVKWDGTADWEKGLPQQTIMDTGPLLLIDGREEALDTAAFNRVRHPRSAVAVTKKGQILLITVDGRNERAAGMSLYELSHFLRWIEADDAINLDGGGSTTLWIKGEPANGVVNYPSDKKTWDHTGERKVANVLLVMKRTSHK
ncbi:MAG: phosphodiester glycosidase family protein [Williamsia sp.]|nr:phosphodiester glycosidase family protein [Williamsia sp.]